MLDHSSAVVKMTHSAACRLASLPQSGLKHVLRSEILGVIDARHCFEARSPSSRPDVRARLIYALPSDGPEQLVVLGDDLANRGAKGFNRATIPVRGSSTRRAQ